MGTPAGDQHCPRIGCSRIRKTPPWRWSFLCHWRRFIVFSKAPIKAPFIYRRRPLMKNLYNRPAGEEMHPSLWWLAPPPCPVGSMSLDSRVAYSSPMNPVPLPPPQAGELWVLSNGAMSLQESIERLILSPRMGWQGNTIRKVAKRPENRVTRFPVDAQRT